MSSYNIKCIGCGNWLNNDINSVGYVPSFVQNKTKYCQRCFKLINYSEPIDSVISNSFVEDKLKKLDLSNSYVFLILDVLNLENSLIPHEIINNALNVFLVVNKVDCLPKKQNASLVDENINRIIQKHGFDNYEILYTSDKNNNSIKRLNNEIKKLNPAKKIYFVGKTNTGKSTLINKLLALNKLESNLTVSSYMSTTMDFKKIKINRHEIIDTPGFLDSGNILNYVDSKKWSKVLVSKKPNAQINFYINPNQSIIIEKLFQLDYLEGSKTSFTFYVSKDLDIYRCKLDNANRNFNNNQVNRIEYKNPESVEYQELVFDLDQSKKYNISVDGLCLISIKNSAQKIRCKVNKNVKISLNEWAII